MNLNEYQELAGSTAIYPADSGLVYTILGLSSEAGELAGKMKKVMRDEDGVLTGSAREALIDELGDVLWYAAMVASELHTNLGFVAARNLNKLERRAGAGTLQGSGDSR